jgi:hypothetical protein
MKPFYDGDLCDFRTALDLGLTGSPPRQGWSLNCIDPNSVCLREPSPPRLTPSGNDYPDTRGFSDWLIKKAVWELDSLTEPIETVWLDFSLFKVERQEQFLS